jgi:hypothetical protein
MREKKSTFLSDLDGRRLRPEAGENRDFRFRSKCERKIRTRTESSPPEERKIRFSSKKFY